MKELLNHEDLTIKIAGVDIFVKTGVFSPDPKISYSSMQVLDNLPGVDGKLVIDVGSGSGVIGIICALNGASKVLCIDNAQRAVENVNINISKHSLAESVVVQKGHYLNGVNLKADFIFANLPISDELWEASNLDEMTLFLKQAKNCLQKGGEIYLTWASFGAPLEAVENKIIHMGYNYLILESEKLGHKWYLLKLKTT